MVDLDFDFEGVFISVTGCQKIKKRGWLKVKIVSKILDLDRQKELEKVGSEIDKKCSGI